MSDVTGPISSLPGSRHMPPENTRCDDHPDRPAVVRLQGETDSFGCEMHDLCAECMEEHRAYQKSPEAEQHRYGQCEWCKGEATDLRDTRDFEEGMCGRIYRVCGACIKRVNDELRAEADEHDDYGGDWDDDDYGDYEEDDHL